MRLLALTLLAVATSVQAHALDDPYRAKLWAFAPARGEFPLRTASAQIRYLDTDGSERLIGYQYPLPYYGSHYQQHAEANKEQSAEEMTREQHFLAWCQERYQALKNEYERLRAEGKKPSDNLLSQIKTLATVEGTSSYESVKETPEVKKAREEHLRIWHETHLQHALPAAEQLVRTQQSSYEHNVAPQAETDEQKKTREQHLRIHKEQLERVQQLETEHLRLTQQAQPAELVPAKQQKPIAVLFKQALQTLNPKGPVEVSTHTPILELATVQETAEVKRAREEHLKLVEAAKLKAQLSTSQVVPGVQQPSAQPSPIQPTRQYIAAAKEPELIQTLPNALPTPVQHTAEVQRAREEHLKLLEEAKLKTASQQTQPAQQPADQAITYQTAEKDEKLREQARLQEEERLLAAERLRETERLREEEKLREAERLRDSERLQQEEILLATEQKRLQQEDELRQELERRAEEKRLQQEETIIIEGSISPQAEIITGQIKAEQNSVSALLAENLIPGAQIITGQPPADIIPQGISPAAPIPVEQIKGELQSLSAAPGTIIFNDQLKPDQILFRLANQPGAEKHITDERKVIPSTAYYYVPGTSFGSAGLIDLQNNPYLLRYLQQQQAQPPLASVIGYKTQLKANEIAKPQIKTQIAAATIAYQPQLKAEAKPVLKLPQEPQPLLQPNAGFAANMPINYGVDASLTELEKATREHFRAHEIALEQLRIANLKSPQEKACN